ncbi:MAG: hypothetical protein ABR991_08855, partial [Terracidiphilus sp.]
QLNGGSSQGLFLFEVVETDNESTCEAFFHRLLSTRRIDRGGGTEFFGMDSEAHMRQTIKQFREMAATLEESRYATVDFEKMECNSVMLEPTADDKQLLSQLQTVEARLLEIKEETEYLTFQREVIQSQLKRRIGGSRGIRDVATWETKIRRNFSEELLRERDPDLYENLLERFHCLDTKAWKVQQPGHYKQIQTTYFIPSITRKFEILG